MIETKTSRFYPFSQQIYQVTFTQTSEQANKPTQRLTISFTQNQCRIVRLEYEHISEIKLLAQVCLKGMMSRVVELNLQLDRIGDNGCKIISAVNLPKLKTLNLSSNKITGKGVFHLAKIPAKLSLVYLSENKIGPEGIFWLCKMCSSMRLLNIQINNLTCIDITPFLLGQSDRMSQLIFCFPPYKSGQNAIAKKTLDCLKKKYSSAQFYY